MHLYEKSRPRNRGLLTAGLVFAALLFFFGISVFTASRQNSERETAALTNALQRAVVTCYAVEGKYPPSLDYIAENYGVSIDETRYYVSYDVFAQNVMPTLHVARIGGGK